jgi:putative hydrolase of the HAD superfamily
VKRAVFFDLDDTLCDAAPAFAAGRQAAFERALAVTPGLTQSALWQAWREAHAELMPQLEADALRMAEVRGLRFRRTLAAAGVADLDGALAEQLDTLLGKTQLAHLRCFDDVASLAALRERGVFVGVITNGADDTHSDSQRTKIEALGLLGLVDGCWVSDTMGYRKPDPRAFAPALAAAGCAASACLYVGDSLVNDIAGANAAGLRSVLVQRDGELAVTGEPQPWRVIRSLWETLDLLELEDDNARDHTCPPQTP